MVDNPTSDTDKNNAATTSKDGEPIVPVGFPEAAPEKIRSGHDETQTSKAFHPIEWVKAWWSSPNRRWNKPKGERAKWTDKAIVVLTGGIVFLAFMQWREMNEGGKQTDKIICADQRLADGMERSADQMRRSADEAVKNSQLQLQLARNQYEAAYVTLTQWMGFYREGNTFFVLIAVRNERGNARASLIQVAASADFRPSVPISDDYNLRDFRPVDPPDLPAHQKGLLPFTNHSAQGDPRVEAWARTGRINMRTPIPPGQSLSAYRSKVFYVWGKIRYKDFGDAPDVPFCRYISGDRLVGLREGTNYGTEPGSDCPQPNQTKPN